MGNTDVKPTKLGLDFIVLGAARSGTSVLGRAINADPGCFCANEYFQGVFREDNATFPMPDAFFDPRWKASNTRITELSRNILREKLAAGEVVAYGNKHPNYFLVLESMHRQTARLRSVLIYRDPAEVAGSWTKRARDPKDQWDQSRTGIFSLLIWMISLARMGETTTDLHVLDYATAFRRNTALLNGVIEHVGGRPPADTVVPAFLAAEAKRGRKSGRTSRSVDHQAFLDSIGAAQLGEAISARGFFPARDMGSEFRAIADRAFEATFEYATDCLLREGSPQEKTYAFKLGLNLIANFDLAESATFKTMASAVPRFLGRLAAAAGTDDMAALGERSARMAQRRLTGKPMERKAQGDVRRGKKQVSL